MNPRDFERHIITFIAIAALLSVGLKSGFFKSKRYSGQGYTIVPPEGWTIKKKRELISKAEDNDPSVDFVIFESPAQNPSAKTVEATITIYTKKLPSITWLEDEFPMILEKLTHSGFHIVENGEIKIDKHLSKWVLLDDKTKNYVILRFYVIDTANIFYQIEYATTSKKFHVYRSEFETAKSTINIKSIPF